MPLSLSIVFGVLASAQDAPPNPLPTIAELVTKLHAPRKDITRYELIVDAKQASGTANAHVEHVWRDGDRYRADRRDGFTREGTSRRDINCTNCPDAGRFVRIEYGA